MKMMNKSKWTVLLMIACLTGCQQAEDLATSATSRWTGIIEEDFERAYAYFSPGHKEIESLESFKLRIMTAKINLNWTAVEFVGQECAEETVCEVTVKLDYSYNFTKRSLGGMDVQTEITENWIKLDDRWYFVPSNQ